MRIFWTRPCSTHLQARRVKSHTHPPPLPLCSARRLFLHIHTSTQLCSCPRANLVPVRTLLLSVRSASCLTFGVNTEAVPPPAATKFLQIVSRPARAPI
ncbi:hypothetical protein OJAV_G00076350 [Oryzias javanicus]|uniref:Uncharacterized protein n=1 Tax=Oryzias javanicus TaxID=123683 RepID=A0A3S2PBB9_ORYJA|nr:hypothetical protein OJAV_G00076350 [Oryzias javanicus]